MQTPVNPLVPPSAGGDVEMMAPLAGPNLQRAARVRLVPCGAPATDAKGVFVEEVPLCHTVREVQAALAARLEADAAPAESGTMFSWLRGGLWRATGSAAVPHLLVAHGSGEGAEYVPAPADMKVEELLAALPAARESSAEGEALTLFYTTETKFGDDFGFDDNNDDNGDDCFGDGGDAADDAACALCCCSCCCCCCAGEEAMRTEQEREQQMADQEFRPEMQPQTGFAGGPYQPGYPQPMPQGQYGQYPPPPLQEPGYGAPCGEMGYQQQQQFGPGYGQEMRRDDMAYQQQQQFDQGYDQGMRRDDMGDRRDDWDDRRRRDEGFGDDYGRRDGNW